MSSPDLPPVARLPDLPDGFDLLIPAGANSNGHQPPPADDESFAQGERHESLLRWATTALTNKGVIGEVAIDAMIGHDQRYCRPPLGETEVRRLWGYLERTKIAQHHRDRPDDPAASNGAKDPLALLVDMREAMTHADEPLPYVVEPIALRGTVTMLVGRHSSMKSWLAQFMAAAAHRGESRRSPACRSTGTPCCTSTRRWARARLGRRFKAHGIPHNAFYVGDGFVMQLPAAEAKLRALLEATGARLLIIDSLRRIAPGVKENDSDAMAPLVAVLARVSRELDVAVVLIHHRSTKPNAAESRGSSSIEDQVDAVFALERVDGDPEPDRRRLRTIKFRHDEEPEPRWISIRGVDGVMTIAEAEPFEGEEGAPTAPLFELVANRVATFAEQVRQDDGWSRSQIALRSASRATAARSAAPSPRSSCCAAGRKRAPREPPDTTRHLLVAPRTP
jgi:hypothetical protein